MIVFGRYMKVAANIVAARRDLLAESIATEGYVPLATLCRKLGVSLATARRDLAHLHEKGRISRVRGGALPRRRGGDVHQGAFAPIRAANDGVASLFESSEAAALKEALCEAGRRCWRRGLVDGSSGHFSERLGDFFLCTPAGVDFGSIRPEMICLVDADGRQVAARGHWKRSLEMVVDLAIYRAVPEAAAVAHAHPPHATAYSFCDSGPPGRLHAEFEVFAGPIARVEYRMPGSPELASLVGESATLHTAILLRNHGVICRGASIGDACLRLELTEAYCQAATIASRLPGGLSPIPRGELQPLVEVKRRLGLPAPERSD
jgi:L-fuculose-phosphate aldolase